MLWALTGPTIQYELEADWALLGLNACTIRPTKVPPIGPSMGRGWAALLTYLDRV